MRRAAPSDRPATEAVLARRPVPSTFPLSNVFRHGMDGAHPRSMSFRVADGREGLTEGIGKIRESMAMPSRHGAPWTEPALRDHRPVGFEQFGTWTLFLTAKEDRIGG